MTGKPDAKRINSKEIADIVSFCLESAGHDLPRALELAAAEILALRAGASAGLARSRSWITTPNDVPTLAWSVQQNEDLEPLGTDE